MLFLSLSVSQFMVTDPLSISTNTKPSTYAKHIVKYHSIWTHNTFSVNTLKFELRGSVIKIKNNYIEGSGSATIE